MKEIDEQALERAKSACDVASGPGYWVRLWNSVAAVGDTANNNACDDEQEISCSHCEPKPCRCLFDDEVELDVSQFVDEESPE